MRLTRGYMKSISTHAKQSGAVSLFVVVFAMLLMSVITVSFLRIMTNDQQQASGNDLAQSAYDSAQAGVEDAKRALLWYVQQCNSGSAPACAAAKTAITSATCNQAIRTANGWTDEGEVKVQSTSAVDEDGINVDAALNQAYTCVTMQLDTDDYVATIPADQSLLIPLSGVDTFNGVTVEWFSAADLSSATSMAAPDTTVAAPKPLYTQADWPENRPAVMRTQFMQVGTSFRLSDFDTTSSDAKSNANTVFLYPSTSGSTSAVLTDRDVRANPHLPADAGSAPLPTKCVAAIPSGGYACSITLTLPTPIGATDRTAATAYLRLTPLYVSSHVRVTLNGTQFKGVQPIVDSTGRANDVFRRVQSRVDLYDTSSFPYPDGAVDVAGSLCKDFGVTDTDYLAGSCTP